MFSNAGESGCKRGMCCDKIGGWDDNKFKPLNVFENL